MRLLHECVINRKMCSRCDKNKICANLITKITKMILMFYFFHFTTLITLYFLPNLMCDFDYLYIKLYTFKNYRKLIKQFQQEFI